MRNFNPHILRVETSEEAKSELLKTGCSKPGAELMGKKARHYCIQVENLTSPQLLILKQELLAIGGECAIPSQALVQKVESGKAILMGTTRHFEILKEKLSHQQFGLAELGEEIVEMIERFERRKFLIKLPKGELELGDEPVIMGILNLTPDSFYDGGKYLDPEQALDRAFEMVEEGAKIIDVGGESTRPGSEPVPLDEELKRVMPVLEKLGAKLRGAFISIDTQKAEVAQRAVDAGASIINDISALGTDPKIAEVASKSGAGLVLMHIKGTPKDMQKNPTYDDLFSEVIGFLRERIQRAKDAGVDEEKIIVDPGIGFGKTVEHNLLLVRDLWKLRVFGRPILLGPSNKSFIGAVLNAEKDDRFEGTAASVVAGILAGADIVRVHEPGKMKRFAMMAGAIRAGKNIYAD